MLKFRFRPPSPFWPTACALSSLVLACAPSPLDPAPSDGDTESDPGLSSSGGSGSGGSGSGGQSMSASGASSGDINVDLGGGTDNSGGSASEGATEACAVAILGDPGSNPGANFAAWLSERGPEVRRFAPGAGLETITAADLAGYDVVFLDWLAPETQVGLTAQQLSEWLSAGGNMVALSGYGDYPEALAVQNELLAPLDLGFVTTDLVWGPVTQFVSHPITSGLTSLTFIGGRAVVAAASDQVLMTIGDPAKPVGVVAERGSGKVFLFGDEWITYDSEWSAQPEIQQFWVNIFSWFGDCELEIILR